MMEKLCCPIEMEPKTLNEGQLNNAREAAANIVQKIESNEASSISIEELRPVVSTNQIEQTVEKRDGINKVVVYKESGQLMERSCGCFCTSTSMDESPEKIREPLSAPF